MAIRDNLVNVGIGVLVNNGIGAGVHNSIYRGKFLGTYVTDSQYLTIAEGMFEDLYIGDYWTIGEINYRIAAFDYYYNAGKEACTSHHVTIVPDECMYLDQINTSNTTNGAYVGSKMYTDGLNQAKEIIKNAFMENHILNHYQHLDNATTSGYVSGGAWYDSTVELMTEQNVYGCKVFGNIKNGTQVPESYTIDNSQYPLFKFRHDLITNRQWYWLRDVVSDKSFARVHGGGFAGYSDVTTSGGVRPSFSIIG